MEKELNVPRAKVARVYVGNGEGKAYMTKNYRAIVNEEDSTILYGMVSDQYKLVQHEEFLDKIETAIARNPEFGRFERTLNFPKEGQIMEAKYRFPDIVVPIDGRNGRDTVNPMIVAKNGHDGRTNLELLIGAFQTFCWNGLVIGKKMMQSKNLHVQMLDLDRISAHLDGSLHQFSDQVEIWKGWVDRLVGYNEYKDVIETLDLTKADNQEIVHEMNKFDEIVDPETQEMTAEQKVLTVWAFYSILTAYATHKVKNHIKRMDLDMRISRAFGNL